MEFVTKRMRARCTCPKGHEFSATYLSSVNIDTDPGALETLTEGGMQLVRCEDCGAVWPIAQILAIHQPERRRVALFVPEVLAHRAYEQRGKEMVSLSAVDPGDVPAYAFAFQVIVGIDALQLWLFGEREPESEGERRITQIPRIHEAFADLNEPERESTTSMIPEGPRLEEVDEEPMYDEDWLEADVIRSNLKDLPNRPAMRPPRPGAAAPITERTPAPREGSGVDFAGLLALDDEEEDADLSLDDVPVEDDDDDDDKDSFEL